MHWPHCNSAFSTARLIEPFADASTQADGGATALAHFAAAPVADSPFPLAVGRADAGESLRLLLNSDANLFGGHGRPGLAAVVATHPAARQSISPPPILELRVHVPAHTVCVFSLPGSWPPARAHETQTDEG